MSCIPCAHLCAYQSEGACALESAAGMGDPSPGGAQQHIDPGPPLPGEHPRREQSISRPQAEQDVHERSGQPRPVPQAAQDIVHQAQRRPQQEQLPRLGQLYRRRQLHQRNSRAKKPEAVFSVS